MIKRVLFYVLPLTIMFGCSDDSQQDTLKLRVVSGDGQSAIQGEKLVKPIVIEVTDNIGNVQPGVQLTASVQESDGTVESISTESNSEGLVSIQWRLGETYLQTLLVSVAEVPSVKIELSAHTNYRYDKPQQDDDGWEIGSFDDLKGISHEILYEGIDELRAGEYPETHSVVLIHNKKLILEEYFTGVNLDGNVVNWDRFTAHTLQSASKSFRSMLTGIAIENGFIESVDVPFYSFFPDYHDLNDEETKSDITLEHVLTMSSGLDWEEWAVPSGHPDHKLSAMYALPKSEWIGYVLGQPMRDVPGEKFTYNTGASLMLDDVIANSLEDDEIDLHSFSKQYYFDLVEEPESHYPTVTKMTPRQMAKMGYVYHYDGKWKDRQVVSEDWIRESTQVRFALSNSINGDYGYQWWIKEFTTANDSYSCFYANGNGGQFIVSNKALDLIVVFTGGNFGDAKMYDIHEWMEDHVFPVFK